MVTKTTNDRKSVIYALISVLLWSTVATAFKIGLQDLQPAQLVLFATVASLIAFAAIAAATGKLKQLIQFNRKTFITSAVMGLINPFIYYIVLFKGYSLLPAQIAQPVNMIWPIVLVLLSVPVLKHKIGWRSMVALLISFFGVVFISSQGHISTFGNTNIKGLIFCLLSSVIWSAYWLAGVKDRRNEVVKLFQYFAFGCFYLIIYTTIFTPVTGISMKAVLSGSYIGLFETGISYVFWSKAMTYSSKSAKIANFIYIVPFLSLFFIHFILGEEIYYSTLVGLIFIVLGILFQQTEHIKQKQIGTEKSV